MLLYSFVRVGPPTPPSRPKAAEQTLTVSIYVRSREASRLCITIERRRGQRRGSSRVCVCVFARDGG